MRVLFLSLLLMVRAAAFSSTCALRVQARLAGVGGRSHLMQPVLKAACPDVQPQPAGGHDRTTALPTHQHERRKALAIWGAGAGLSLLPLQAQARAPEKKVVDGAPPTRQTDRNGEIDKPQFQLPLAVGLGTCCPCDVRGEGGDEVEENSGECDPTYEQVSDGIAVGYRFLDTASHYNNEGSGSCPSCPPPSLLSSTVLCCALLSYPALFFHHPCRSPAGELSRNACCGPTSGTRCQRCDIRWRCGARRHCRVHEGLVR